MTFVLPSNSTQHVYSAPLRISSINFAEAKGDEMLLLNSQTNNSVGVPNGSRFVSMATPKKILG